jgi:hypothetical protein
MGLGGLNVADTGFKKLADALNFQKEERTKTFPSEKVNATSQFLCLKLDNPIEALIARNMLPSACGRPDVCASTH